MPGCNRQSWRLKKSFSPRISLLCTFAEYLSHFGMSNVRNSGRNRSTSFAFFWSPDSDTSLIASAPRPLTATATSQLRIASPFQRRVGVNRLPPRCRCRQRGHPFQRPVIKAPARFRWIHRERAASQHNWQRSRKSAQVLRAIYGLIVR